MPEADPRVSEKEAHIALCNHKFKEAFLFYEQAGEGYAAVHDFRQSALCFAAAAGAWIKECGEQRFLNAALFYRKAAEQAERSSDFEYAALLYQNAAINYERDGDFHSVSECFYRSKEARRKFLFSWLFFRISLDATVTKQKAKGAIFWIQSFLLWCLYGCSSLIWGHGERPFRAFVTAIGLIVSSTFFYMQTTLESSGKIFSPSFGQAFYFSIVTFTTVGYGDMYAVGVGKAMAMIEALCGVFLSSICIVALSRKYLRA